MSNEPKFWECPECGFLNQEWRVSCCNCPDEEAEIAAYEAHISDLQEAHDRQLDSEEREREEAYASE